MCLSTSLEKKVFHNMDIHETSPRLVDNGGKKSIRQWHRGKIEHHWSSITDLPGHGRPCWTCFYYYLFYVYCRCLLSTVHRQCADIRVQLAACGGPSGTREVKKVLMNDQAADRKPGWCGSAFMGSSGPSSPLSPSSSSIPSSIIRSFRESEKKRWASFFIINTKKSTDLVHKKGVLVSFN